MSWVRFRSWDWSWWAWLIDIDDDPTPLILMDPGDRSPSDVDNTTTCHYSLLPSEYQPRPVASRIRPWNRRRLPFAVVLLLHVVTARHYACFSRIETQRFNLIRYQYPSDGWRDPEFNWTDITTISRSGDHSPSYLIDSHEERLNNMISIEELGADHQSWSIWAILKF